MKKGFTLIELVMFTLLFSVLAGFVVWTFVVGLRAWGTSVNRANLRQSGNLAIEMMVRELSQAYSIRFVRDDEIRFWPDAAGAEEITFSVAAGELTRASAAGERILTPYVQDFVLAYWDLEGAAMIPPGSPATRANIRVITVSLILNEGDETVTLTSGAYARNQGL